MYEDVDLEKMSEAAATWLRSEMNVRVVRGTNSFK